MTNYYEHTDQSVCFALLPSPLLLSRFAGEEEGKFLCNNAVKRPVDESWRLP
jgi:hypothetical protein